MASAPKRGKFIYEQVYEEDDLVHEVFFSELAEHIVRTELDSLAKHLDLPEDNWGFSQDFLIHDSSVYWVSNSAMKLHSG